MHNYHVETSRRPVTKFRDPKVRIEIYCAPVQLLANVRRCRKYCYFMHRRTQFRHCIHVIHCSLGCDGVKMFSYVCVLRETAVVDASVYYSCQ